MRKKWVLKRREIGQISRFFLYGQVATCPYARFVRTRDLSVRELSVRDLSVRGDWGKSRYAQSAAFEIGQVATCPYVRPDSETIARNAWLNIVSSINFSKLMCMRYCQ